MTHAYLLRQGVGIGGRCHLAPLRPQILGQGRRCSLRRYRPCFLGTGLGVQTPFLGEGRIEDARLPRFANVIGAIFLTASFALLLAGFATIGWALALIVAALALLAASTGLCVGCEMYMIIARVRGMGLAAYIDQQLHPERVNDPVTDAALAAFTQAESRAR